MASNLSAKDLLVSLSEWGIGRYFSTLGADWHVMADSDFLTVATGAGTAALQCTTGTADDPVPAAATHILVVARRGELAQVRALRRLMPARVILSFVYDVCPYFPDRPRYGKDPHPKPRREGRAPNGLMFFGPPGTEMEYLADLMAQNGLGRARESLGRPFLALAAWQVDFRPVRYVLAVGRAAARRPGSHLILQTDCLDALQSRTLLDQPRLLRLLKKSRLVPIHVGRRDKIMQVGLSLVFSDARARSFWTAPPAAREKLLETKITLDVFLASLFEAVRAERALELVISAKLGTIKALVIEDVLSGPHDVVQQLALLTGLRAQAKPDVSDYWKGPAGNDHFMKQIDFLRREVVDRIGLQLNAAGSLVSKTEAIRASLQED